MTRGWGEAYTGRILPSNYRVTRTHLLGLDRVVLKGWVRLSTRYSQVFSLYIVFFLACPDTTEKIIKIPTLIYLHIIGHISNSLIYHARAISTSIYYYSGNRCKHTFYNKPTHSLSLVINLFSNPFCPGIRVTLAPAYTDSYIPCVY